MICWALVLAAPVLAPVVALSVGVHVPEASPRAWLGFGYVSLVSMFLGFLAWYRAMALAGVARVGQLQLLQPLLTLLWSALLLGSGRTLEGFHDVRLPHLATVRLVPPPAETVDLPAWAMSC